jgi:hypothetical protein
MNKVTISIISEPEPEDNENEKQSNDQKKGNVREHDHRQPGNT